MFNQCVRLLIVSAIAAALPGCDGRPALPLGEPQPVPAPATSMGASAAPAGYVINPLDVLRIDVFGEPELSFATLPVNTDGRIIMPMVGSVAAAGSTAEQLTATLTQQLNRYLRNPKISVNVVEFVSQKVTVAGAVLKPGQYLAPGKVTLMQAVAIGGGLNGDARANEVIIFREQDGRRYAARFDLDAIQNGQAPDPAIQAGDTVVVGISNARRLFRDVSAVLPIAAGVFIALIN